jgi:hypothetical protein
MSRDHINKYFREIETDTVNPLTILDMFNVTNPHLRQSFVNIVLSLNACFSMATVTDMIMPQDKYHRGVHIDVYDVLHTYRIFNPALQHAVKKILLAGFRGHKDFETDLCEIISALSRAQNIGG